MIKYILPIFLFFLIIHQSNCAELNPQLSKYLLSENFQGKWQIFNTQKQKKVLPWTELESQQGIATVYFTRSEKNTNQISGVVAELLMPKYYDEKVLKFRIMFSKFNGQLSRWEGQVSSNYEIYEESSLKDSGNMQTTYIVDASLIGIMVNQDLNLTISFQPKYLSPYTSFFFVLAAFFTFIIIRRKNKVEDTRIRHQVIPCILSSFLLLLIAICEIIIGFRSLFGKMSPEAFLTVAGFINLSILYQISRFYWSLLFKERWSIVFVWVLGCFYIWFLLFFKHNPRLQVLNALIFIPQIGYHCFRGQKIEADYRFIWFLLSNQIYIMYFKSCPANMFKQSPSYLLAYLMLSLLIAQIGIYLGQIYIGPRFFIPSILLPIHYDYYDLKNLKSTARGNIQCYICLQEVKILQKKRKIMVTPCSHVFHSACLEKWMAVQMKCPVDRCELPPL